MNKIISWIIIGLMLMAFPCTAERGYQVLTTEEAEHIIYLQHGYILLDVRTEDEYDEGHIPGAINIPIGDIKTLAPRELPNSGKTILVYCRDDKSSREAAKVLAGLGYTQVVEFGGIDSWDGEILSTDEEDDPFEAREYGDPEDFYYDYYDEFDDYDEAEEYYYEHGGW